METLLCVRLCAIVLFLLAVLFPGSSAQQQFRTQVYANCLRNATSLTTEFRSDLETALRDFASLSAGGTTYTTSTTTNSLYAMFQCRGDLSPASCSDCVQNATALLPQACPLSVGARLRLDGCFLRYDNQSFFHLDTSVIVVLCNTATTTDLVALNAISDVMLEVIAEAPKTSACFASANARDMYGIAECWRYLNESECSQCLRAIPYSQYCGSGLGQTLNLASCDYRYENYNFLDSTSPSPPRSSPETPPSSPSPPPISSATPPAPPPSGDLLLHRSCNHGISIPSISIKARVRQDHPMYMMHYLMSVTPLKSHRLCQSGCCRPYVIVNWMHLYRAVLIQGKGKALKEKVISQARSMQMEHFLALPTSPRCKDDNRLFICPI